ncbi:MAG TPA: NUDIX domain-containing protein [Aeromicrobium sp.]|nr:NUDIX domain-containing protein [Aeromicrobium sp.]
MTEGDGQVPTISVVAAFTTDAAGRILMVRKKGSEIFMQPGGKPEAGEDRVTALRRELAEELELEVGADDLVSWGRFEAAAANEPGHRLVADVFGLHLDQPVNAAAEIAEARWFTPSEALALGDRLAPLARQLLSMLETDTSA